MNLIFLELLDTTISVLAFLVAICALRQTRARDARDAARERAEEQSRLRADVLAYIMKPGAGVEPELWIENKGAAIAQDVDLTVSENESVLEADDVEAVLPIAALRPGQHERIRITYVGTGWAPIKLVVTWRDAVGQRSEPFELPPI